MADGKAHIAGPPIRVGDHLRQLCTWCGYRLIDEDLSATFSIDDCGPLTWPVDSLVNVFGHGKSLWSRPEDGSLPPESCAADHLKRQKPLLSLVRDTGSSDA